MPAEDVLCPDSMQRESLYDVTYFYCRVIDQNNYLAVPLLVLVCSYIVG